MASRAVPGGTGPTTPPRLCARGGLEVCKRMFTSVGANSKRNGTGFDATADVHFSQGPFPERHVTEAGELHGASSLPFWRGWASGSALWFCSLEPTEIQVLSNIWSRKGFMRDMQMLGRSEVLAGTMDASGQKCPVVAVICWRVGECGLGDEDPDRFSICFHIGEAPFHDFYQETGSQLMGKCGCTGYGTGSFECHCLLPHGCFQTNGKPAFLWSQRDAKIQQPLRSPQERVEH